MIIFSQLKVLTWVHNYPKAERANLNDWYIIFIGSRGCCLHLLQRTHCTGWTITESFLRIIKHKPAFIPHAGFELLLNNFFNSFSLGFCSTCRSCLFHLHSFQNNGVDPAGHTLAGIGGALPVLRWYWLYIYCANDKVLPGLLVAVSLGAVEGKKSVTGVRGSGCVGVRTPWLSELLPWPLIVDGQSRAWFLLCFRGQSPAGCSPWEIRSAVCFSQIHFLVAK